MTMRVMVAKKFIAKNGDISVELDALPNEVMKNRLIEEVEKRMDLDALAETKAAEAASRISFQLVS
jgi:hypothetical protein